jgi:hypothetical protein
MVTLDQIDLKSAIQLVIRRPTVSQTPPSREYVLHIRKPKPIVCQSFVKADVNEKWDPMEASDDVVLSDTIRDVRKRLKEASGPHAQDDAASESTVNKNRKARREARRQLRESNLSESMDSSAAPLTEQIMTAMKTHDTGVDGGHKDRKTSRIASNLKQGQHIKDKVHSMIQDDILKKPKKLARPTIPPTQQQTRQDVQRMADYDPRTDNQKKREQREQIRSARDFYRKVPGTKIANMMGQFGKKITNMMNDEAKMQTDEGKRKMMKEMAQESELFSNLKGKRGKQAIESMRQVAPGMADDMERLMFSDTGTNEPKRRDPTKKPTKSRSHPMKDTVTNSVPVTPPSTSTPTPPV